MLSFPRPTCTCQLLLSGRLVMSVRRAATSFVHHKSVPVLVYNQTIYLSNLYSKPPALRNQSLLHNQLIRWESSKPKQTGLVKSRESPYAGLTPAQKVKEASKDTVYTGVIIVGVGVTALMFYAIGKELLSKESPSGVYGEALKLCKRNTEVIAALGEPVKGYGEMSSRGRRRHVSHAEFDANGVHHMRMKFYLEGPFKKGTVQLEVRKTDSGKYEYKYLYVELDGYPHRRIVIQDNR